MRKLIATLLAAVILWGGCINVTLDLYGVKTVSRAAIAEELASGGEAAAPAVAPKPSSKQQASVPAGNSAESPAEKKADEGSGEPVNSVESVSETTVTSTENFDTDVTENGPKGATLPEGSTVSSENAATEGRQWRLKVTVARPVTDAAGAAAADIPAANI